MIEVIKLGRDPNSTPAGKYKCDCDRCHTVFKADAEDFKHGNFDRKYVACPHCSRMIHVDGCVLIDPVSYLGSM